MIEVFAHPEQVAVFTRAAHGEPVDWDTLYRDYQSTVDAPGCMFWRELMDRFPDAPVLLSVRDPERWCDSFQATIGRVFAGEITPPIANAAEWRRMLNALRGMIFDGDTRDRASLIAGFNRHNDAVRAGVPAERLIEYDVSDGWEPLCAALGVPVPDAPLPRTNTREEWMQIPSQ
jgi:hypothetical protein